MTKKIYSRAQVLLDKLFRDLDRKQVLRTKNIQKIPGVANRRGGKVSYAEWAHVTGIFQTLLYQHLPNKSGNRVLDVGCGTGLLALAAEPFISDGGSYTGIDVMAEDIEFCKKHYQQEAYQFIHFDVSNPTYASNQSVDLKPWPIEDDSMDLVTALSVWTHLSEEHAEYYFKEIYRVLKPDGRAVISFFYLDDLYEASLEKRQNALGRFHSTNQMLWVFDQPAYESKDWFSPKWVKEFEDAIGVNSDGMDRLVTVSHLGQTKYYPGNWKEIPGVFFQDVFVFDKT